jgi:beta-glucosidase
VRLLKHFKKQDFQPGESRELTFTIQPAKPLSYPAASGQRLPEDSFFYAARGRPGGAFPLRRGHGAGGAASRQSII